jgi:secreted trypsin-like serine protease
MTAAHCVESTNDFFGGTSSITGIDVFVNSTTVKYSKYEYYRTGIKWIVHPYRNKLNQKNDIALIFLDAPVIGVQPVKMNKDANIPVSDAPSPLTVIGLGANGTNTTDFFFGPYTTFTSPDQLMKGIIDTVPVSQCKKTFSSFFFGDSNICAGGDGVKKAACFGDSGGPLLLTKSSAKEDVQIGIVSWGPNGCTGAYPDVYTRVSYFAKWVEGQICTFSKSKPSTCPIVKPTTRKPTRKPTKKPTRNPAASGPVFAPVFAPI